MLRIQDRHYDSLLVLTRWEKYDGPVPRLDTYAPLTYQEKQFKWVGDGGRGRARTLQEYNNKQFYTGGRYFIYHPSGRAENDTTQLLLEEANGTWRAYLGTEVSAQDIVIV